LPPAQFISTDGGREMSEKHHRHRASVFIVFFFFFILVCPTFQAQFVVTS